MEIFRDICITETISTQKIRKDRGIKRNFEQYTNRNRTNAKKIRKDRGIKRNFREVYH